MNKLLSGRTKGKIWIGLILLLIIFVGVITDWIVEWLWLDSLGYEQVFWTIKSTQFLLLFIALAVALLYVLPNIRYLLKNFQGLSFGGSPLEELNIQEFTPRQYKSAFYGIGTFVSLFFSFAFFVRWDAYFRFHWNEMFNRVDP
ncbi:MAG: UPF0182 family protein, partial [Balneolaceae bacterium]|nr:UPF0182 family protein [Balneolaceae bacterium]